MFRSWMRSAKPEDGDLPPPLLPQEDDGVSHREQIINGKPLSYWIHILQLFCFQKHPISSIWRSQTGSSRRQSAIGAHTSVSDRDFVLWSCIGRFPHPSTKFGVHWARLGLEWRYCTWHTPWMPACRPATQKDPGHVAKRGSQARLIHITTVPVS